jgi:ureidoacrylate peracid hydrolase
MPHAFSMPAEFVARAVAREGREHSVESIDTARTALLAVDMQRYFMEDPFPGASPQAPSVVPNVNRLAEGLRRLGGTVVWLQNAAPWESERSWSVLRERYSDGAAVGRWGALQEDADGFELYQGLNVAKDDLRAVKERYSAFIPGSSDLEARLRERDIDTLLIVGVATNVCCESTARDAMMLNFRVVMVSDACAATSDAEHAAALGNVYLFFGDVQTTDEVVAILA